MGDDLPAQPRTIKPRARAYKRLPVIVVTGDIWIDEDGQTRTIGQLLPDFPKRPSTLFACVGAADLAAELDVAFSVTHPKSWQWRVTTQEKGIIRPDGLRAATRMSTVVHYFGFKNGYYHKLIDPVTMYGRSLGDIWPGDESPNVKLMQWATTIRDFCDENGLEVRPTIGAISGQFLTDRRFYPNARRKVPSKINASARGHLPGNHYALTVHPSPRREYNAHYLDQHRAHHYHARTTRLPDANSLYAYGWFVNLDGISFEQPEPGFTGLYCLTLDFPDKRNQILHWLNPQCKHHFVFSNELPLLLDMGYKVTGIVAAWGSHQQDKGIARYSIWANQQLDIHQDALWLKPLLLATYGTLATRPTLGETIFRLAKQGEKVSVYAGRRELTGLLVHRSHKLEPGIANVIHRGMIEAATRAESIGLAHWLQSSGHRVLSIYADAVMVEVDDDKPLPQLPDPWRPKETLNHLQFVNKQAFISGEMTKLPGVTSELRKFARNSNGLAPQRVTWDAITNQRMTTGRKI